MATMIISLPDPMKDRVEAQTHTGRYSDAGDSVRDLIRRDQKRTGELGELRALIDEGTRSGVGDRTSDDIRRPGRTTLAAADKSP